MPTILVNGVQLFYRLDGDSGDPLVLVHGSWTDHLGWRRVAEDLSSTFRVCSYDRRGHSQSERMDGIGSIREDVADLAAVIETLGLAPAHVVGTSFGGSIVLRLAAERPDLFLSLAVHEPPLIALLAGDARTAGVLAAMEERTGAVLERLQAGDVLDGVRMFVETIAFGPGAWDTLPREVRVTFLHNTETWMDEIADPDAFQLDLARLASFPHPVLLTQGETSAPFFPALVDRVASAFPEPGRATYEAAGHVPHLTHPVQFLAAVRGFVVGQRAGL